MILLSLKKKPKTTKITKNPTKINQPNNQQPTKQTNKENPQKNPKTPQPNRKTHKPPSKPQNKKYLDKDPFFNQKLESCFSAEVSC